MGSCTSATRARTPLASRESPRRRCSCAQGAVVTTAAAPLAPVRTPRNLSHDVGFRLCSAHFMQLSVYSLVPLYSLSVIRPRASRYDRGAMCI